MRMATQLWSGCSPYKQTNTCLTDWLRKIVSHCWTPECESLPVLLEPLLKYDHVVATQEVRKEWDVVAFFIGTCKWTPTDRSVKFQASSLPIHSNKQGNPAIHTMCTRRARGGGSSEYADSTSSSSTRIRTCCLFSWAVLYLFSFYFSLLFQVQFSSNPVEIHEFVFVHVVLPHEWYLWTCMICGCLSVSLSVWFSTIIKRVFVLLFFSCRYPCVGLSVCIRCSCVIVLNLH